MDERYVQQIIKHRHFAKDQCRSQPLRCPGVESPRKSIAGPSVIRKNSSDGGYLLVFRNESTVKAADFSVLQRTVSPYTLMARSKKKAAVRPRPKAQKKDLPAIGCPTINLAETGEAGSQTSAESTIIAQPSAHKTMSIVTWQSKLSCQPKQRVTTPSRKISHRP